MAWFRLSPKRTHGSVLVPRGPSVPQVRPNGPNGRTLATVRSRSRPALLCSRPLIRRGLIGSKALIAYAPADVQLDCATNADRYDGALRRRNAEQLREREEIVVPL